MLRALFRQKLEGTEITPSPELSAVLMKKLRRKEFLHFNPGKFNIWYTAGIFAVTASMTIILSTLPVNKTRTAPDNKIEDSGIVHIPEKIISQPEEVMPEHAENITRGDDTIRNTDTAAAAKGQRGEKDKNIIKPPADLKDTSSVATQTVTVPEPVVDVKIKAKIIKLPDYSIRSSVTEGCVPLKVKFETVTPISDSCLWSFSDGGYSVEKAPSWLYDFPGEYKVTLKIFKNGKVQAVSYTRIKVFTKPVAKFEMFPEKAVIPDDEITFQNFSTNAVKYIWKFGDGSSSALFEPKHTYSKYDNYDIGLIAVSENGCSDSVVINNAFSGSGYFINFPNAFIPNPDGPSNGYYSQKSDESSLIFHPDFNGVAEYRLRIFSRRGVMLFESNDINIGWDGYFRGQYCEPGVYIWKVRGKFANGEPFIKMGDITLLKN